MVVVACEEATLMRVVKLITSSVASFFAYFCMLFVSKSSTVVGDGQLPDHDVRRSASSSVMVGRISFSKLRSARHAQYVPRTIVCTHACRTPFPVKRYHIYSIWDVGWYDGCVTSSKRRPTYRCRCHGCFFCFSGFRLDRRRNGNELLKSPRIEVTQQSSWGDRASDPSSRWTTLFSRGIASWARNKIMIAWHITAIILPILGAVLILGVCAEGARTVEMKYGDGSKYVGEERHGKGKMKYKDASKYDGG